LVHSYTKVTSSYLTTILKLFTLAKQYKKTPRKPHLIREEHHTSNTLLLSLFFKPYSKLQPYKKIKNYNWNNITWSSISTGGKQKFQVNTLSQEDW